MPPTPANGDDKDDKPLVPPLSPPPVSGGMTDSLSKPPASPTSPVPGGEVPIASPVETPPPPLSEGAAADMNNQASAESRVTHEATAEGEPKKSHKGLLVIIIVGIIILILGGIAYAASSCSISVPGLSALFSCEEALTTDQGFIPDSATP